MWLLALMPEDPGTSSLNSVYPSTRHWLTAILRRPTPRYRFHKLLANSLCAFPCFFTAPCWCLLHFVAPAPPSAIWKSIIFETQITTLAMTTAYILEGQYDVRQDKDVGPDLCPALENFCYWRSQHLIRSHLFRTAFKFSFLIVLIF